MSTGRAALLSPKLPAQPFQLRFPGGTLLALLLGALFYLLALPPLLLGALLLLLGAAFRLFSAVSRIPRAPLPARFVGHAQPVTWRALRQVGRGGPPAAWVVREPAKLRRLRAIQVLEQIGNREARRVLAELARGAPTARETRQARAALGRLVQRRP